MSVRSLAKVTNAPQADSAVTTNLLKHAGVKQVEAEHKSQPERSTKNFERKSGFQQDFSRIPVSSPSTPLIQPKLVVGQPSDRYEQEADRVAEQVMRMPASGGFLSTHSSIQTQFPSIQPFRATGTPSLQRESEVQEEDDEEQVQAKSYPGKSPTVSSTLQTQLASSQSGGQPLPRSTRADMESRFGRDFSSVRIHSDGNAASMNRQLNAMAFTHRQHIYFGHGQYQPQTMAGQQLLAHELTHVVQQTGEKKIQPKSIEGRPFKTPYSPKSAYPSSRPTLTKSAQFSSPIGTQLLSNPLSASLQSSLLLQTYPAISSTALQIQGYLPDLIADKLNDYARYIPGYTLFTVIIGVNPLTSAAVEPTAINLVQGLMELVPFGAYIFDTLQRLEILQPAFAWVEEQLDRFDLSLSRLERLLDEAYEKMDFIRLDPFDYNVGVLEEKFSGLLEDVRRFAASLVDQIIQMIKDATIGVAENLLADNPAWNLLKKVLHYDPLRGEEVEAPTVEILADFLMLIGKEQELEQMREKGTLQETADWLDTQLGIFLGLLLQLTNLFTNAWAAIQPENLPNLSSNLESLANQAVEFLRGLGEFALTIALKVLEIIKNALLGLLREHANTILGYHLLTVMVGKDVFTQEEVPLTPTNLIRGFMSLIPGGEEQFQQMQETGVIPDAAQRIESAMTELGITWPFVQQLFLDIWNSFTIEDMVQPLDAFIRVLNQFEEPLNRLFTFVIEVIKVLLELVLVLMNFPTDLIGNIIANTLQALDDIQRDPVGFLINLLETAKRGFERFFNNILEHLLGGLADWLFREVSEAGIQPPADLTFESILGFVMDILGLSMDHMWELLAEHIGQETVDRIRGTIDQIVQIAGEAWGFIQDVQERGMPAIWEYIESQLTNLWDMVISQVQEWVMERIVNVGMRWLVSLLDVTGITPVINSFVAFFNAIQSAIEYLREMLEVVNDFVSTVASIARGDVEPGAERMEQGLRNILPIFIGFLANQFGLGNIGEQLQEIIAGVREMVDAALNWLIAKALQLGRAVLRSLGLGGGTEGTAEEDQGDYASVEEPFTVGDAGERHRLFLEPRGNSFVLMVRSVPETYAAFINSVETGTDQQKISAKQQALVIAGEIDHILQEPASDGEDKTAVLRQKLDQLADQTAILWGTAPGISTPPIWGTMTAAGFGTRMTIEYLTSQPAPGVRGGRPTSARNTVYEDLNRRRQGGRSYYVKGHLLSQKLNGPGGWNNLTPLFQNSNQDHEALVESQIKGGIQDGKAFRYIVEAIYQRSRKDSLIQRIRNSTASPADKQIKEKIVEAEVHVPTHLAIRAVELDPNTRQEKSGGLSIEISILNRVDQSSPDVY